MIVAASFCELSGACVSSSPCTTLGTSAEADADASALLVLGLL
jgi:hypothetical protein